MLWYGYIPETVWFSRIVFNVIAMVVRLIYLNKITNFEIIFYVKKVMYPLSIIIILTSAISLLLQKYDNGGISTLLVISGCVLSVFITSLIFAFTKSERQRLKTMIISKIY